MAVPSTHFFSRHTPTAVHSLTSLTDAARLRVTSRNHTDISLKVQGYSASSTFTTSLSFSLFVTQHHTQSRYCTSRCSPITQARNAQALVTQLSTTHTNRASGNQPILCKHGDSHTKWSHDHSLTNHCHLQGSP